MGQSDDYLIFSDISSDMYKDHVPDAIKQFRSCGEQCDPKGILLYTLMKNAQTFLKSTLVSQSK